MKGTAYLIQATLITLWWIGMLISPKFYEAFQFPGISNIAFNSFMLPDLIVVAFLSIIRAYNDKQALDYVILGGFGFATLYCVNASFLTSGGLLSTTIMLLGFGYNLFLISDKSLFRDSLSKNFYVNAAKTFLQIICIWTITLFIFPALILESFGAENIYSVSIIGYTLFALFSIFGLYSAYIMVKIGEGTPLPLDQTQKLVTKGPYKYVRNPMAIAGIGQGIAVSIILWSVHILIYVLLGAILWQYVVRPIEEKNMKLRFGQAYIDYTKRVKCWIPRFN